MKTTHRLTLIAAGFAALLAGTSAMATADHANAPRPDHPPLSGKRAEHMNQLKAALNLSPEQQKAFDEHMEQRRMNHQNMTGRHAVRHSQFHKGLEKPCSTSPAKQG